MEINEHDNDNKHEHNNEDIINERNRFFSFFKKKHKPIYQHTKQHISNVICSNCLCLGHYSRNCNKPIHSFGIICFTKRDPHTNEIDGQTRLLCIQRRHSTAILDILTGNYDIANENVIKGYFSQMTLFERLFIYQNYTDFLKIWDKFIGFKKYKFEQTRAKEMFEKLDIKDIITNTHCEHTQERFGYPKGRRKINETTITCALREFEEETGYSKKDISLLNVDCIHESVTALNGKIYDQTYFMAEFIGTDVAKRVYNEHNREVKSQNWFMSKDFKDLPFEDDNVKESTIKRVSRLIDWRF